MRYILMALLFGLLTVACGGDDGSDEGSNRLRSEVSRLTGMVSTQLGADAGFDAIVFAFERGYSPGQVLEAIEKARLLVNGKVGSPDGSTTLTPASEPLGLVVLPDSARKRGSDPPRLASINPLPGIGRAAATAQEPPLLIEVIREHAKQEAEKLSSEELDLPLHTYLVLGWLAAGYSPEQMIEALILGERYERASRDCMAIMDSSGRVVFPTGDSPLRFSCTKDFIEWDRLGEKPSLGSAPTNEKEEAPAEKEEATSVPAQQETPAELAGTYLGEMTLFQCTVTCDTQCEVHGPVTLRLLPDGTIIGSTGGSADFRGSVCVDPLGVGPPIRGSWDTSASRLDITVEAAVGTIGPAILSLMIEDGQGTLTLLQDTREGDQARITQFDAVLTKQ